MIFWVNFSAKKHFQMIHPSEESIQFSATYYRLRWCRSLKKGHKRKRSEGKKGREISDIKCTLLQISEWSKDIQAVLVRACFAFLQHSHSWACHGVIHIITTHMHAFFKRQGWIALHDLFVWLYILLRENDLYNLMLIKFMSEIKSLYDCENPTRWVGGNLCLLWD